jgi:hypothetical protein
MLNHSEVATHTTVCVKLECVTNVTTQAYTIYPKACSDVMHRKQCSTAMKQHYTILCVELACVSDQSHNLCITPYTKSMLWCYATEAVLNRNEAASHNRVWNSQVWVINLTACIKCIRVGLHHHCIAQWHNCVSTHCRCLYGWHDCTGTCTTILTAVNSSV